MVAAADLATMLPVLGAAGALSVGVLWLLRYPRLAVGALCATLIIGQLVRGVLPGQGGGVLVSDAAVCIILAAALFEARRLEQIPSSAGQVLRWWLPWLAWSLASLLIHYPSVLPGEWLVGLAYWVRTSVYLLLLPALIVLLGNRRRRRWVQKVFLLTIIMISVLGFMQVWLWPNLVTLGGGWDPHEGRLTSTWLDPNFVGGLFAMTLPWLVVRGWSSSVRNRWLARVATLLVVGALLLTTSRSSFVALAVSMALYSPLILLAMRQGGLTQQFRLMLVGLSAVTVLSALGLLLLGDRSLGLLLPDATVRLRWESLQALWPVAVDHSLIGVGYNLYQFSAKEAGLIGTYAIHSRAGADNSVLTLWVTTGIPGVVLFAVPWLMLLGRWVRTWMVTSHPGALATAMGLTTWLIHGQFVNSLLYPHLLVIVALLAALALTRRRATTVPTPPA